MRKIERHLNLTWSGWPIANGWIMMRAKYGKDDDDDDFCEDWHDEIENWAYIYEYTRE